MRTICDVCESSPAILFCAADEAALCRSCDHKVHMCNKLASRHVRVGLADPTDVPRCDICENAPAFFYCEIDGSSLCLQCDMIVHVGGKRTHGRYLLLRQRIVFPGDKANHFEDMSLQQSEPNHDKEEKVPTSLRDKLLNHQVVSRPQAEPDSVGMEGMHSQMIDLNARPAQALGRPNIQAMHPVSNNNHKNDDTVPNGSFKRDTGK